MMTELLTAAQMRAIETAAIESGEVTGLELMERAGRGVVEAILAEWPELGDGGGAAPVPPGYLGTENSGARRAVVLCGPGNNGGDGFVVARLLKERGWEVKTYLWGDPGKLPAAAATNYRRWSDTGGKTTVGTGVVVRWTWDYVPRPFHDCSGGLVVDALFGTGLTRNPDDLYRLFERYMPAKRHWKVIAVDTPSFLDADSGRCYVPDPRAGLKDVWQSFRADLAVTFHARKVGHMIAEGPARCGHLRLVDIGLRPQGSGPASGVPAAILTGTPVGLEKRNGHKFDHGHALVLSGPSGHGGAARLAARGALRIGAGLVTLGCPPDALAEAAARLDAVMLREVADGAALTAALEDARISAVCLGPGLGTGDAARALVAGVLGVPVPGLTRDLSTGGGAGGEGGPGSGPGRGIVLDADALTVLSRDAALFAMLHDRCILTPHGGEFARLFPDIAAKLEAPAVKGPAYSKVDATREAAARAGCVVLFKGADTVIADPSGRCSINTAHYDRAAPWLATAGSGDVLAGFITGLLARGFAPMQAAETAAWLHVECARSFGPGLIAEDLPEELPKVFRALGI